MAKLLVWFMHAGTIFVAFDSIAMRGRTICCNRAHAGHAEVSRCQLRWLRTPYALHAAALIAHHNIGLADAYMRPQGCVKVDARRGLFQATNDAFLTSSAIAYIHGLSQH